MIQDRECRECHSTFLGGPRAYYCPTCREERQRKQWTEYQRRKRVGNIRPLGSIDTCERCGKPYTVDGGLQRFCPDCQPIHAAEHDAKTSLEFYHGHKETINPVRNERRRVGTRNCDWCGKEYTVTVGGQNTCSDECKKKLKNKKWNEIYGPRYKEKKKAKISEHNSQTPNKQKMPRQP